MWGLSVMSLPGFRVRCLSGLSVDTSSALDLSSSVRKERSLMGCRKPSVPAGFKPMALNWLTTYCVADSKPGVPGRRPWSLSSARYWTWDYHAAPAASQSGSEGAAEGVRAKRESERRTTGRACNSFMNAPDEMRMNKIILPRLGERTG
jgi:hypothetical protein